MKVIVGLGNPGSEYDETRHNMGWWVLDRLAYDWGFGIFEKKEQSLQVDGMVGDVPVILIKPTTFMNKSGIALISLSTIPELDVCQDLLVVSDDVALPLGSLRFRPQGGSGGHNGLKSVSDALGTEEYGRLRLGVGPPPLDDDLSDWLLSPMNIEDQDVVVALLPKLSKAVEIWLTFGMEETMNQFN